MPLINCDINLILIWSANSVIVYTDAGQGATKLYVPVVTLPTQDNAKFGFREKLIGTNIYENQNYQHKMQI